MADYFVKQGHDVSYTHMSPEYKLRIFKKNQIEELDLYPTKIKNIKHLKFFMRRLTNIIFLLRVRRLVKKEKPDIFMINPAELMYLFLLSFFIPKQVKFVLDIRQLGLYSGKTLAEKIKNIRAKIRFRLLSKFVFEHTCFAFEDAAIKIMGNNWRNMKVSLKPVGVNQVFLDEPRTRIKGSYQEIQLVYVGSLNRIRYLEFIIDSFKTLLNKTSGFHLTLIGPDPGNHYHSYINNLQVNGKISILDPIPYTQIPGFLNNYDVAIAYVPDHPDWHYQPTLKVLEYCAVGIPIVATDNPPNRSVIKENITGLFFNNTQDSFCQTIQKLKTDLNLLDRLSTEATFNRNAITWHDSAINYEHLFTYLKNDFIKVANNYIPKI